MVVQVGGRSLGYDKSLTLTEQIADVKAQIARRLKLSADYQVALADSSAVVTAAKAAVTAAADDKTRADAQAHLDAVTVEHLKLKVSQPPAGEGSPIMNYLRQHLAELEGIVAQDVETRARLAAEEARERAKNPNGTVASRL